MKKTHFLSLIIFLLSLLILLFIVKRDKSGSTPKIWTAENALSISSVPVLDDSNGPDLLINAIDNSLIYLNKKKAETKVSFGESLYSTKQMIDSLEDFKENLITLGLSEKFFQYVRQNYIFYSSNAEEVLFTGYYEADLSGSLKKDAVYKYPIYRKPEDLVRIELKDFPFLKDKEGIPSVLKGRITKNKTVVPFYSRDEIDGKNALKNKDLEILWVDDLIDLFFLQIQGSGIVRLVDGRTIRINYSESNGHPYRAIGRYLVEHNFMDLKDISMQSIRKFLKENPEKITAIFNYNPSYVFFRQVEEGPIGSIGVPITPYRSIATDKSIFPKGALCFIKTRMPVFDDKDVVVSWKDVTAFVLNQDTGGAIRSPGRVDLFTGFGHSSELVAGHLKQYGKLYFLIKKSIHR